MFREGRLQIELYIGRNGPGYELWIPLEKNSMDCRVSKRASERTSLTCITFVSASSIEVGSYDAICVIASKRAIETVKYAGGLVAIIE